MKVSLILEIKLVVLDINLFFRCSFIKGIEFEFKGQKVDLLEILGMDRVFVLKKRDKKNN